MKPTALLVVALAAVGCSAHRSESPAVTALPGPTTVQQLCDGQIWPRAIPNVVGRLLYQVKDGALGCFDHLRAVAPDGHDPLNDPARPVEKTYRIAAVSPAVGTPIGRHDLVTVELAEIDATAPPAFRPCDWVTTAEAADILGGSVRAESLGVDAGSVDIACIYDSSGNDSGGVEIDLQVPGAFPVDAASEFALATAASRRTVAGLGVKASCIDEPTTSPPATTLVVLLDGGRLLRVTQGYGSCDVLQRFARIAIGRI